MVNSLIIIDFADSIKDFSILKILNRMIIKQDIFICCSYFTLQSYYFFPKILRKHTTYISIFEPKNIEEFYSLSTEVFNMNQDDVLKLYDFVFSEP